MDFSAAAAFQDDSLHVHRSSIACGENVKSEATWLGSFIAKQHVLTVGRAFLNAYSNLGNITSYLQEILLVSAQTLLKACRFIMVYLVS